MTIDTGFTYTFPAIRGRQAQQEYFVAVVPLNFIPKIFLFDEEELPPKVRAQRNVNKARIPEIAQYILNNPKDYVFSAITASIDGDMEFIAVDGEKRNNFPDIGKLNISMSARFLINDGQHRRAGIERAMKERPELGNENIAVVFFKDAGLKKCQQMFADLNRYAQKPTKSLSILYDYRDDLAELTRQVSEAVPAFIGMIDTEKVSLAARNPKLFTLSSLYEANRSLTGDKNSLDSKDTELAVDYWNVISEQIPDWELAKERKILVKDLRKDTVHAHGVILQALGVLGNYLLKENPDDYKNIMTKLSKVDWSRDNSQWEGLCMHGGRMSGTSQNVRLTSLYLRKILGLNVSKEELTDLKTTKREAVKDFIVSKVN